MSVNAELIETDTKNLEKLDDNKIIHLIHCGNSQALDFLIHKYAHFVRAKARTYFIIGADKEDIIQEGMIGLYKAIRDFDGERLSSFKAFAELCVTRQIITAIKTATRQKHTPLNSYVSLDKPIYDEESDRALIDVISGTKTVDPQEILVNKDDFFDMEEKLSELLSTLEKEVLRLYLDGCTYQEISVTLRRHVKSIDNAVQRIKRKLEQLIEKDENSVDHVR
ncbi:RNA polymerase sporulation sigma factor SigH [Lentibacillus halophilus]|uniref:RNA polymerase sporulation sigma factor SigH n=1 Tax=Lentibacillus halophilus TaxID=295065 RepID=UPI0031DA2348